jgi:chemotaxis protein MotB
MVKRWFISHLLYLFTFNTHHMRNHLFQLLSVAGLFILISCGPSKKLKQSRAETARVSAQLDSANTQINDLNGQVSTLTSQNSDLTKKVNDCVASAEEVKKQKERMEATLAEQAAIMKQLKEKVAEALNKYEGKGVDITYKDGLVYISMQDKLLFKTGSAQLGKEGKEALSTVAEVVNQSPNVKIIVLGNTDSVSISKGFKDNWSLSTERANSVVRILRDQYEVDPSRLTAAGRSKYGPIADNSTDEGRAKNRRTEIILNPDLSKLWEIIDTKE